MNMFNKILILGFVFCIILLIFIVDTNDNINWYNITIDDGNYNAISDDNTNIYNAINNAINDVLLTEEERPVFSYNSVSGKTKFTTGTKYTSGKIIWYLPKGEINNTDIFGGNPPTMCDTNCGIGKKANSNLGYLLGFRNTKYEWNTSNTTDPLPITSEAIINLYGPRYLMLILDDYNQNHLNKGLVSIQDVPKKADLPSYYDPNLPCVNAPTDESQGTLQSYPFTLQGAPRRLTKAKQDTINSIMKDRSQTTSNKVKSVTDSDMFALIPIKKSINTQIGEGLTEFSGPIQVNERIYFGPVDIDRMRIRLVTDKGDTLNLNGNDWSFCMIAEVLYQY